MEHNDYSININCYWKSKNQTILVWFGILLSLRYQVENKRLKGRLLMKTIVPWNIENIALDWLDYHYIMGFPDHSVVKNPPANTGDKGSISSPGRAPGGGNDNPLQYSCLRNPIDRGAWWAKVCGVSKSWARQWLNNNSEHYIGLTKKVVWGFSITSCWQTRMKFLTNPIFPCVSTAEKSLGLNIFIWPSNHTLHPFLCPSLHSQRLARWSLSADFLPLWILVGLNQLIASLKWRS